MISPHTPPGTKVICVDAGTGSKFLPPGTTGRDGHWRLSVGETYTVDRISLHPLSNRPAAILVEVPEHRNGYDLARFRLPITPESLGVYVSSRKTKQREKV